MYVSRLTFHALPGKTTQVQEALQQLEQMVADAGGIRPRVLRTHLASLGAPDVVFEQEANDLAELESEIQVVTGNARFQEWSASMSALLEESPKREIYQITSSNGR